MKVHLQSSQSSSKVRYANVEIIPINRLVEAEERFQLEEIWVLELFIVRTNQLVLFFLKYSVKCDHDHFSSHNTRQSIAIVLSIVHILPANAFVVLNIERQQLIKSSQAHLRCCVDILLTKFQLNFIIWLICFFAASIRNVNWAGFSNKAKLLPSITSIISSVYPLQCFIILWE